MSKAHHFAVRSKRVRMIHTLIIASLLGCATIVWIEPGTTQDLNPTINTPDKFAWDLFIRLNHPADLTKGRGIPDATKKIGDPGLVVWETWKLARTEVFLPGGVKPSPWDAVAPLAPSPQQRFEPSKLKVLKAMALGLPEPSEGVGPLVDPVELTNESRLNRATFEFVVNNELYNVEGQEAFQNDGRKIDFPIEAMEIKGSWKELGASRSVRKEVLNKYHTADVGGKVYGLVGLHIITKDVPNWFWATFEHVDNPPPEIGDVDRSGYPRTAGGSPLPPSLKGTKWENYRLRGTQVDFTDSKGNPTILGNTQIEQGFQATSSCISCHANATIGDKVDLPERSFVPPAGQIRNGANRLTVFFSFVLLPLDPLRPNPASDPALLYGPTGRPDPALFSKGATGRPRYTQLDFLWSLRRAKRKTF